MSSILRPCLIKLRLALPGLALRLHRSHFLTLALHLFAPALFQQFLLLLGATLGLFPFAAFGRLALAALRLFLRLTLRFLALPPFRRLTLARLLGLTPGLFRSLALLADTLAFGLGLLARLATLLLGLAAGLFGILQGLLARALLFLAAALLLGLAALFLAPGLFLGAAAFLFGAQLFGDLLLLGDFALVFDAIEGLGIHRDRVDHLDILLHRDLDSGTGGGRRDEADIQQQRRKQHAMQKQDEDQAQGMTTQELEHGGAAQSWLSRGGSVISPTRPPPARCRATMASITRP